MIKVTIFSFPIFGDFNELLAKLRFNFSSITCSVVPLPSRILFKLEQKYSESIRKAVNVPRF